MAKRTSLREFQADLAARLASARRGQAVRALLGVESGGERWLVDLDDSGEVVPMPPLAPVPLTQAWFAGLANVRGMLYSVVDFAAFRGLEPTPRNADARLLLIGARHGVNSALLVDRTLGLKPVDTYAPLPADATAAAAWRGDTWADAHGGRWIRLLASRLLEDPTFMSVGI